MIPLIDLKQDYLAIKEEIDSAIQNVLQQGMFISGEHLMKFEQDFSGYIGTKYGIGVNSGSDALFLALKSIGIQLGDEVITVSHTFISTVDSIVRNGARPKFVDIDPETYTIDITKVKKKITPKTRAIIPVHLYGHPSDMKPLQEIADDFNLYIVEDACQAHGASYQNQKVGGIGDIGCFSFYPTKNLGCYGDGGMVVTNNKGLAEKIQMLRQYGQIKKNQFNFLGVNSRLDELQAAILHIKLKYLDQWNIKRRQLAHRYTHNLENSEVVTPFESEDGMHVFHHYVIQSKKRDKLQGYLLNKGIYTQIHYPIPVHKQKSYIDMGVKVSLPMTETICNRILSLPMFPTLQCDDIDRICDCIKSAV